MHFKGAKVNSIILETNAYYDIADFNGFTPYLTAGVGVAKNKFKVNDSSSTPTVFTGGSTSSTSSRTTKGFPNKMRPKANANVFTATASGSSTSLKKTGFAWNIGFGGMYNIDPEFGVDLAYRYRDLGKVTKYVSKKLKSHNVTVGMVHKF